MKRSTERILTTHAGSLPRPVDLQAMIRAQQYGQPYDQNVLSERVQEAVAEVVGQQTEAGVDIISDGEQGKTGFLLYGNQRLTGFESVPPKPGEGGRAPRRASWRFLISMRSTGRPKEMAGLEGNRFAPGPSLTRDRPQCKET
jgi:methionine synthase II (cobalamin-independent)